MPLASFPKAAEIKRALENALLVWPGAPLSLQIPEGQTSVGQAPDGLTPDGLTPTGLAPVAQAPSRPPTPKNVGGQAVIEGVIMRGEDRWAVMVREPGGAVVGQTNPHAPWNRSQPWKFPFILGVAGVVESMVLGVKALNYSTEVAVANIEAEEKAKKETKRLEKEAKKAAKKALPKAPVAASVADPPKADKKKSHGLEIAMGLVVGLGLGVILFVALPHALSYWLGYLGCFDESSFLFHLLDGIIKFAIFLAYVYLIGLIPDIARVYAYHGAEHQAIHAYEAGLPLQPGAAKSFPTWHPRCGTAFLFLVLAASLLFFAIIFPLLPSFDSLSRVPRILAGVALKILCAPFLAGLAYEITRLASKPNSGRLWRAMVWPGLVLQRLTTRQPDDSMLEVAFKSLEAVMPEPKKAPASA